jgi:putative ABC transport system permease protein
MYRIAFTMLIGDRGKYFGILMGVTFASLLITHQESVFVGIMTRTYSAITDMGLPDVWVMDTKVQFVDDVKPLQDTQLQRVRGVAGIEWAVPLYKGLLKARLPNGLFQTCNVFGLDDASLIGGPPEMVEGALADLRRADGVIVDIVGATGRLARPPQKPGDRPEPLKVGDTLELNDRRAVVVGICRNSRTFQSQPVIYTTYSRATLFAPRERKLLSFILVKAQPGQAVEELCTRVTALTGLSAVTREGFKDMTAFYFLKFTGIPINIGIAMLMSFIVGTAIAGQTFYTFTLENLRYFGTLKAMGAHNAVLFRMMALQAIVVAVIGYGLGIGGAATIGYLGSSSEMAWRLMWPMLLITGGVVILICVLSASFCVRKVMRLEPAMVFRT